MEGRDLVSEWIHLGGFAHKEVFPFKSPSGDSSSAMRTSKRTGNIIIGAAAKKPRTMPNSQRRLFWCYEDDEENLRHDYP
jgi:hypothetical protein